MILIMVCARETKSMFQARIKPEILSTVGPNPAINVARIFDWGGGANHKSHAMTSSEIFERGIFRETKISQNGGSEAVVCVWHLTRILLKREGLNQMSKLGDGRVD